MSTEAEKASYHPLTPPMVNVLVALGRDALHGYGIMKSLAEKTGGQETLLPGSLYATLARMLEGGLIEELVEAPDPSADARRRYYRATTLGLETLEAEAERMLRLARLARGQLSSESA